MYYNELFIESKLPNALSKQDSYKYLQKYHNGDKFAREILIKHNIRLVLYQVVKKFGNTQFEQKELVSIGIIGLIKSIDTFDITKCYEFTTYATKCINNEILMFIRKNKKYINDSSLDSVVSINKDGEYLTILDTLTDDRKDFVSCYEDNLIYQIIRVIVSKLPKREKTIVMLYFGFKDNKIYNQCEIAEKLNLSQPYVSRLLNKTLEEITNYLVDNGLIEITNKIFRKRN